MCNIMIKNILKISSYEFMSIKFKYIFLSLILCFISLKFKIDFAKSLKAKEFVSIEKNLFLVTFATKIMH